MGPGGGGGCQAGGEGGASCPGWGARYLGVSWPPVGKLPRWGQDKLLHRIYIYSSVKSSIYTYTLLKLPYTQRENGCAGSAIR